MTDGAHGVSRTDLDYVLMHTAGIWDELRGRRIFITGATGFVGCWLLESFAYAVDTLDLRASAVVLTRDAAAFQRKASHLASHPALTFHCGDVRSFSFPAGEFSHIIHAATTVSTPEAPATVVDTVVQGTARTLALARQCGAQKFLFTSSGAVYGKQPASVTHLSESFSGAPDPTDVGSAYGEGKRLAELLCAISARDSGLAVKIARCFALIGPYLPLDAHFAVGNFIRDGLAGGPILVSGDGTPLRSYLYGADLAVWLWTILFSGVSGRPYNVGSDAATPIAALAATVARAFGSEMTVTIARQADPDTPPDRYVPSTRRALQELGLRSTIGLEEAIRRTIAWHHEQGR